jgi:galactose oxidase-like protein
MTDPFERRLTGLLRGYADGGVRPIDRFAIAEETIMHGQAMPRWRRGVGPLLGERALVPLVVGLLLTALVGGALLAGSRLIRPLQPLRTYIGEFVSAPDLSVPMSYPRLVALVDGRVLVIGHDGADGSGPGIRALIYDPTTGISEATGELVSSDAVPIDAAVSLKDGRVLVIGTGSARILDPNTRRFTPTGPMVMPRQGASVVALRDGRVLIAGGNPVGEDGATSSAELFDPASLTFSPTGSMTTTRSGASMAVLADGRVFMAPGDSRYTVEIYDPRTGTFSDAGQLSSYGFDGAVTLPDGRVFVFGGSTLTDHGFAQVWDPTSLTVSEQRDLPGFASHASPLEDGRILLTGGEPGNWSGIFDPATQSTTRIPSTSAWKPGAIRLADGRVLIVGGDADGDLGTCCSWPPGVTTVQIFH